MIAIAMAIGLGVAGPAAAQDAHGEEGVGEAGQEPGEGPEGGEGAEAEHAHMTWSAYVTSPRFIASSVNFLLLVFVIWLLARKKVPAYLKTRREQIEVGLAEAARLRGAAESKKREYEERLGNLQQEIERLRTEMIRAGEAERDRIVAEAEVKASRMRRETEFLIEQQMKQLRIDLTREAVDSAIAAAERVLSESTTAEDHQRLAKDYLSKLGANGKNGGAA